jgi:hypothetical protein
VTDKQIWSFPQGSYHSLRPSSAIAFDRHF